MCGICGIYYRDEQRSIDPRVLRRMTDALAHRGPDGEGQHVDRNLGIGHRRLAIIDLSDAGRQPMSNEDGSLWISFNGEIYNYLELRQGLVSRGHAFRSHTDTEVVLHAFEEEGARCLTRLNGMFAFAIWNARDRTLFLARDRLGIKPLYYAETNGSFSFASEIKALLRADTTARLNRQALTDYLRFQFCLGEKTLFEGIRQLPPAHFLRAGPRGDVQIERYWDVDFTIDVEHDADYFEHQLLRLLEDAVRLQLRADVPVGAYLSGGLDSSVVTCLASSLLDQRLRTFTGAFRTAPEFDETGYARTVADHARTCHQEVFPTEEDFVSLLPLITYHMDEPAAGPGSFPQYCVSRAARQQVKVVLGGQGGDEIFGGYTRYLLAYLEQCIKGGIEGTYEDQRYVVTFESIIDNLREIQGYQPLLQSFWKEGLFESEDRRYCRLIDRSAGTAGLISPDYLTSESEYNWYGEFRELFFSARCRSLINKMTWFDMRTLLPALLHVEDRVSMAVSLESRVPLLDHRIVELVASMPPMIKYKGGRSKHIFRAVARNIVPQQILARQDKMGFPVPLNHWYKHGVVRDFARDILTGTRARQRGFLDTNRVASLLDEERAYGRTVWGLVSLELWMQTFLDAPSDV